MTRPTRPDPAPRNIRLLGLLLVATTALASCAPARNTSDGAAGATTSTDDRHPPESEKPVPTTTVDPASESPQMAYLRIMSELYELLADPKPNPEDSMIERNHKGRSLTRVRSRIREQLRHRWVDRFGPNGPPVPRIRSTTVRGDRAVLRVCIPDDLQVTDQHTGKIVDGDVLSKFGTVTLVREDRRWRLEDTELERTAPGIGACG